MDETKSIPAAEPTYNEYTEAVNETNKLTAKPRPFFWLVMLKNNIRNFFEEWYYTVRNHYFIERTDQTNVLSERRVELVSIDRQTNKVSWVTYPRHATVTTYLFGVCAVLILRYKDKEKKYRYCLINYADMNFINHVRTGEKL